MKQWRLGQADREGQEEAGTGVTMPGYMAGIVWDFSEFKKTGKIVIQKISSSPPSVDVEQLAKEALEDVTDKLAEEALGESQPKNAKKNS